MSNEFVRLKSASLSLVDGAGELHSYLHVWVKVKNLAYAKDVQIHYRGQNDTLWQDRPLAWKGSFGNYDVFALEPTPDFGATPSVEFAIKFVAGGVTYWDNNNLANYSLAPPASALTGGNVTLNFANLVFGGTPGSSYVTGIAGEILVNNVSSHKIVGIRHSSAGWTSSVDIDATFSQSVGGGSLERWIFGQDLSPEAFGRGEFAVYCQNGETGQYFWDDNFSQNYDMRYRERLE
jgi:hypothetical protein